MNKWKKIFIISLIIMIIAFLALTFYIMPFFTDEEQLPTVSDDTSSATENNTPLADNPIDFASLKERNTDIYAWIRIPGTSVDYAVVQSDDEPENYYLNHNIDGKYQFSGSIYSQKLNKKDFSDPNTILYGHNMDNGSMFATLHRFRKKDFFDSHDTMYIYTEGHILTYKIYAAYRYDNRHILYSFNFSDKEVFQNYLAETLNPKSTIVNVREGVNLTADDKIVTLSTCITNSNYRYLVQGVLISDQKTR